MRDLGLPSFLRVSKFDRFLRVFEISIHVFFFIRNRSIRNSLSENPGPKKLSTSTIVLGSKVRKKLFRKKPRFGKILHRIFYFYYIKISKSVRNLTNSETVKKLLRNFDTKNRAFFKKLEARNFQ